MSDFTIESAQLAADGKALRNRFLTASQEDPELVEEYHRLKFRYLQAISRRDEMIAKLSRELEIIEVNESKTLKE
jgi:hypothetical protein